MVPHHVVGPLCFRANNSSYDLVVLMKGVLCSARNKLKRLKRCEPLPETTSHRGNTWIMRAQVNSLMKFIVHCCEIFVAICNSLLSVCVENLESLLSSVLIRTALNLAQRPSNSPRASNILFNCSTSIRATVTPFRGVTSTRPVPLKRRRASRIGVRDTPNFRQMLGSSSRAPGSISPDRMAFTSAWKTSSDSVTAMHRSSTIKQITGYTVEDSRKLGK